MLGEAWSGGPNEPAPCQLGTVRTQQAPFLPQAGLAQELLGGSEPSVTLASIT